MDRSRLFPMPPCATVGMIDFGLEEEQGYLAEVVYELEPILIVIDALNSISA
jgi:hypothetical protein